MARREQGAAAEMLGELESAADRLGDWLQKHLVPVSVAIVGLLAAVGIGAWVVSSRHSSEQEASHALYQTRSDYLAAMGADAYAIDIPELANPSAAAGIRAEYEQRYAEVEEKHAGTVAGALAAIERAGLLAGDGRGDEAIGVLEKALESAPANGPVRGMLLQRLAQRYESAGRWAEAAERHEAASKLTDYPLHAWALADAARARAMAGEADAARALYDRLDREAPDLPLSDAQRAQALELRAAIQ